MHRIQRSVDRLVQKLPYVHRPRAPTDSLTPRGLQPLHGGPHAGEGIWDLIRVDGN